MKHILRIGYVCILLTFIFTTCKAQRIKYDDLLYSLNHSIGDIDHRLLTKGISFSDVYEIDDWIKSYRFTESDNRAEFLVFSVHIYDDKIFESDFSTSNHKEYLLLRTDIVKLGFSYDRNVTKGKTTYNYYVKGNYEACFSVGSTEYDEKLFNITLANKSLKREVYLEVIRLEDLQSNK